ncbi:MAG: MFS transporter [Marmoricola sp.]
MNRQRLLLALAAVAVAFAAADTYVVVLALPDMMITVGLGVDQLQRAAPIVSGFLLGYVAMLPLIGRIADLRGRVPVLIAALLIFAFGSLVTALAFDLTSIVAGRFLQGMGGGGLVPATLALVADLYPTERRAVPLGVVSAVQEVGSVLGPLYGALVLAVADWETIFWINLAVGLVLAAAIAKLSGQPRTTRRIDWVGLALLTVATALLIVMLWEPEALVTDVDLGLPFVPLIGQSRWLAPLSLIAVGCVAAFVWHASRTPHPLIDVRSWSASLRAADPLGAALLGLGLGAVIIAFASADPAVQVFSPIAGWLLAGAVVAFVLFVLHVRRAKNPLVPSAAVRERPAWGSLFVSFFMGSALIAALVDIPVYARLTTYRTSQLMAALVLVRLLAALPVGAIAGGFLTRRFTAGVVAAAGMALAAAGFALMTTWDAHSLESWTSTLPSGSDRLWVWGRARPGQRGLTGQHAQRRARRCQRPCGRGSDVRDAHRDFGPHHYRYAPVLSSGGPHERD